MSRNVPCPDCTDGFTLVVGGDGEKEWAFCKTCKGDAWVDPQHWINADREQTQQIRKEMGGAR